MGTGKKRETRGNPNIHNLEGMRFSSSNQPSPESKKKGWEEFRKERNLTKEIIKMMIGDDGAPNKTFEGYLLSLLKNAKIGNSKAIDTINRCLEDEIIKVAKTNEDGEESVFIGMIVK